MANNLVEMFRDGEGAWTYGTAPQFNEVPSRSRAGGTIVETRTWDPVTGRMLGRNTSYPDPADDVSRGFADDGSGRLRLVPPP